MFRRDYPDKQTTPTTPGTTAVREDATIASLPLNSSRRTHVSWNDPPVSWASSSTSAYDINPKYTTANNSYTHRRRKSMITNLIARQNDPYQPIYRDWRDRTPDSPRGSFSLGSGINDKSSDSGGKKVIKLTAGVLVLLVLLLGGFWIWGGPMPLSGHVLSSIDTWQMPGFISKPFQPDQERFGIRSASSTTLTTYRDADELWATSDTVSHVVERSAATDMATLAPAGIVPRSLIKPVGKPVDVAAGGVAAVESPIQARNGEPSSANGAKESKEIRSGNPSHVEEMFRKHAMIVTPIARDEGATKGGRPVGAQPPSSAMPFNTASLRE